MAIDCRCRRGAPVKVRLVNERRSFHGMQHPIHLHGQRFLVLAVNGVQTADLVWKDTVLVPAGSLGGILLRPAHPGAAIVACPTPEPLPARMLAPGTLDS